MCVPGLLCSSSYLALPRPGGCRTISGRSLIRSVRSPEDRRPIEGLTSKPRPNSEPALFFFFFFFFLFVPTGHHRRGSLFFAPPQPARATAMTRFTFFSLHEPSRDPWHTARLRAFPGDWGFFRYKKRSISIQDIIIYHHISCLSHDISLYIIYEIMIYHVPRRHMIYMISMIYNA